MTDGPFRAGGEPERTVPRFDTTPNDSIKPKFSVGDCVLKCTGDYQLVGEVRAVFTTTAGKIRYAVEHPPGFVHIYAEINLMFFFKKDEK